MSGLVNDVSCITTYWRSNLIHLSGSDRFSSTDVWFYLSRFFMLWQGNPVRLPFSKRRQRANGVGEQTVGMENPMSRSDRRKYPFLIHLAISAQQELDWIFFSKVCQTPAHHRKKNARNGICRTWLRANGEGFVFLKKKERINFYLYNQLHRVLIARFIPFSMYWVKWGKRFCFFSAFIRRLYEGIMEMTLSGIMMRELVEKPQYRWKIRGIEICRES